MLVSQGAREAEQGHPPRSPAGISSSPGLPSQAPFLEKTAIAENRTGIGCGSCDKRDAAERASSPRESLRPPALAWLSCHCSPVGGHQPCDGTTLKPREPLWVASASWKQATDPLRRPPGALYLERPGALGRATNAETGRVQRSEDQTLSPEGITRPQPLARQKASGKCSPSVRPRCNLRITVTTVSTMQRANAAGAGGKGARPSEVIPRPRGVSAQPCSRRGPGEADSSGRGDSPFSWHLRQLQQQERPLSQLIRRQVGFGERPRLGASRRGAGP